MAERRTRGDPGRLGVPDIGYGRGYGRDFGGGYGQGFDGSWGQGYGGSLGPSDYREGFGGEADNGGMAADDYEHSFGGRGGDFGGDDRSWMEARAEEQRPVAGPHAGKGPGGWSRSDARLKEQVSEALMQDRLLDARNIEVDVDGGVVSLDGTVAAASGVRLAEIIVQHVGGVKAVRNRLSVQSPATADDRAPLGVETGAYSPLAEGQHDASGREEGPRHFPKLAM